MVRRGRSLVFLVFLAIWIGSCGSGGRPLLTEPAPAPSPAACTKDVATTEKSWALFRSNHPFHFQGVSISKPFAEGCRTLVVSEPPPHATLAGVTGIAPDSLAQSRTLRHLVGHDGWVADLAFTLPPMPDEELRSLVGLLHLYLFGTSYKAHAFALESAPAGPSGVSLDVRVGPEELERWVLDDKEAMSPVDRGTPASARSVLDRGGAGVYFSARPGLVIWAIPKGRKLDTMVADARRFAVDSDLLIGAIGGARGVLLVGRERVAPLDFLPPLRAETLTLLASVKDNQLGQSYERNHVFAGPLGDGNDWAPIYLSPELIDTELGSLLNITDQLLKGWSNAGQTTYERFDYPHPSHWPFQGPLPKALRASTLTYNWNTQEVGGSVKKGGHDLLFFGTTGALHVSYLPGESGAHAQQAEKQGYEFFATSGDPNLARAMEYTAMFQIFRRFGITADAPTAPIRLEAGDDVLRTAARQLLGKLFEQAGMTQGAVDPARLQSVADVLASPRTSVDRLKELVAAKEETPTAVTQMVAVVIARELSTLIRTHPEDVATLVDRATLQKAYVDAANRRPDRWIHTPSVVISRNVQGMAGATGGHSIDATVREFPATAAVDLSRVRMGLLGERGGARTVQEALGVPPGRTAGSGRGFQRKATETPGFDTPPARRPAGQKAGSVASEAPFSVSKAGGVFKVERGGIDMVESPSVADVLESVLDASAESSKEKPLVVDLGDMSENDARALHRNLEMRAKADGVVMYRRKQQGTGTRVDAAELVRERYDFSKAELRTVEHRTFANGESAVAMEIKIPPKVAKKPSLLVRMRVFFRKLVPEAVKKTVSTWFEAVKARIGTTEPTGHDIVQQLRQELRKELKAAHPTLRDDDVRLDFGDGTDDVILVERSAPGDGDARAPRVPA